MYSKLMKNWYPTAAELSCDQYAYVLYDDYVSELQLEISASAEQQSDLGGASPPGATMVTFSRKGRRTF